ncbi:pentatricopeptide repeat-containing protein At1g62350-like isoform X1 [Zingiber officinale]|uniref:pentatricopeptide repeat-containing protein At1g62350-like isoform X1 n=1 Tax=Zingiber officinale TaxID=94328 RepID=UPI001C4CFDC9|nr:pentatricopeptide repeat-containing protein At1g62350-like isoform X1 [Zingiber officinale]
MLACSVGPCPRLQRRLPPLSLARPRAWSFHVPLRIHCGIRRAGARKPLWRDRVMSTEAIQVVQALKFAKASASSSPHRLDNMIDARFGRLLKADQLAVLDELQRQNEWQLALQVFAFVRKELWYKPDSVLYGNLIFMLGKNKLIEQCEDLFSEFQNEKLQPDTRVYTEMIGAFLQVNMVEKAMEKYKSMKELGTNPDKLTLTILIRNLEKVGLHDLASNVRKDCADFVEYPEKFLEKVDKNYIFIKGKNYEVILMGQILHLTARRRNM